VDGLLMTARELGDERYAEGCRPCASTSVGRAAVSIFACAARSTRTVDSAPRCRVCRTIGTRSDLTVHVSLDEPNRLPAQAEAELLRIAQQAIANARRHAQAENLWVTCRVAPPHAQIVVEDDGRGLIRPKATASMTIIRERAQRLARNLSQARNRAAPGSTSASDRSPNWNRGRT
jgi:signal transduction histidine kinase